MQHARRIAAAAWFLAVPVIAYAQGTAADYARSEGLGRRLEGLVINQAQAPTWVGEGNRFWYRKTVEGGNAFVVVDAATGQKQPAFDHARLATALSQVSGERYTPTTLPFNSFTYAESESVIEFVADSVNWRCGVREYFCENKGRVPFQQQYASQWSALGLPPAPYRPDTPRRSPDGKWEAMIRNHNIAVREVASGKVTILSVDGIEGNAYQHNSIRWSPDSKKLVAYRVKPGHERLVHWVESSPDDQFQPKHYARHYAKPGDELEVQQPVLFDVETQKQFIVDRAQFPNAYALTDLVWRKDSRAVTFEYNQRGHQVYRVIEVDANTGTPRVVISEEPKTFFTYSSKKYRYDLKDGAEVIWMSERDGWNHLYLIDGTTGRVKNQITKGEWVVRGVDHVDEEARQIYFRAGGMYAGKDPYLVHYYRINFDGSGLVALTEADANHQVSFSPDRKYYVDLYSRVDAPPVLELRRTSDRTKIAELERADDSKLRATGWRYPEVFVAKGRDGKTDIWGIIIRPTNFDPNRKYPVVENIYAGPHGQHVPKSFSTQMGMQSLAELGFIVVQIDGMGTNWRSKAFHDVAWQNLKDAGFPDRILWHKAANAKYSYYDTSRVGIYGTSAGGQNSMGALLFHPEFYKAAVSAAGCHDNRMDKIWWNEQWMGTLGKHYEESSNVVNAHRLQGKLLLVVGELDTNVDPASTFQVVDALIEADKNFDLLVIPGAGHTNGGAYGNKKRNDFFVHHLMGIEPPDRNVALKASSN